MSKVIFQFVNNPDKTITAGTTKIYKGKLNALARNFTDASGVSRVVKKEDILNNAQAVADYVNGLKTKQARSLTLGAIFYAIGRQDFDQDPRGKPIFEAFQQNYKSKVDGTDLEE